MKLLRALYSWRPLRFLIGGGIATFANFVTLFVLVHFFHLWYLLAAILSFTVGMTTSFFMQKFFTFSDYTRERVKRQTVLHMSIQLFNLGLNTLAMYVGVDLLHLHYLLAQFAIAVVMASYSFLFYKYAVFTRYTAENR